MFLPESSQVKTLRHKSRHGKRIFECSYALIVIRSRYQNSLMYYGVAWPFPIYEMACKPSGARFLQHRVMRLVRIRLADSLPELRVDL